MFLTLNDQDALNTLALNVVHREREIYAYQLNINNYNFILNNLPEGDAPAEIASYISAKIEDLPLELSLDTISLISDYQYRNHVRYLIRTETIEQSKSKKILESLKAQIPADQLDALVADAVAKINAQTPAA